MKGLKIEDLTIGTGAVAEQGSTVSIRWKGTLNRGDMFREGEVSFRIGERRVIAGLEKGVVGMRVGGIRKLRVSPHLGYSSQAVPSIPANAVLTFEIELVCAES